VSVAAVAKVRIEKYQRNLGTIMSYS